MRSSLIADGPKPIRSTPAWEQAVRERGVATMRGHRLSRADVERRWIINRILCHGELRARDFEETFGRVFAEAYQPELASLAPARADGLIELDADGSLRTTPLGRLLVRTVAMAFDAYLPDQQKSGTRIFSKTV